MNYELKIRLQRYVNWAVGAIPKNYEIAISGIQSSFFNLQNTYL